jgi:hypothetical protein
MSANGVDQFIEVAEMNRGLSPGAGRFAGARLSFGPFN